MDTLRPYPTGALDPRSSLGHLGDIAVPELHSTRIRNTIQRWLSRAIPVGRKHWFPNHKHSHRFRLSLLQNPFDCRGPLQTLWSSWRQKQHNAYVRKRRIEALLKLRNIGFIQRDERRLAGWSGTRSPEVKPDRQNRNCKHQPERSVSCHQFLPRKPVSDELREHGDQDHHSNCDPEQRHADGTTLGAIHTLMPAKPRAPTIPKGKQHINADNAASIAATGAPLSTAFTNALHDCATKQLA